MANNTNNQPYESLFLNLTADGYDDIADAQLEHQHTAEIERLEIREELKAADLL